MERKQSVRFTCRPIRPLFVAVVLVLRLAKDGAASDAVTTPFPSSPAHLFGLMNRQWPGEGEEWFTAAELQVISTRFERICGLDGHGYDFPGAISWLRTVNPEVVALSHWEAMGIQGSDIRMAEVDNNEDIFIHSADPACLAAVSHNGHTVLWFRQDARNRQYNRHYAPTGVEAYIVEVAASASGPFTAVGNPVPESGRFYYRFDDSVSDPNRVYRVRTRLTGGQLVDYSWAASVDLTATATLAIGGLFPSGLMVALCYGDCPTSPSDLRVYADLDNDHVYEAGESFAFSRVGSYVDGSRAYLGTAANPLITGLYSYNVVNVAAPAIREPLRGAYQSGTYNNRIQMRGFGSYLVWPNHPTWVSMVKQRLSDALAAGFNGLRLDFVMDTLDLHWTATGLLPDWTGSDDSRIVEAMDDLLAALAAHEPSAVLSINGRFVAKYPQNYFNFLENVEVGEFEFFALGNEPNSTVLQSNTGAAIESVWATRAAGKSAGLISGAAATNRVGRLQSFAMYLLIVDDGVYFYNSTDFGTQDVVFLPEWDVPLGDPVRPVNDWYDLLDSRGTRLLSREFQSGWVFLNADTQPVTIPFQQPMHRLSVTGGLSTLVGGDGEAQYTSLNSLTLAPREAAIVVAQVLEVGASVLRQTAVIGN